MVDKASDEAPKPEVVALIDAPRITLPPPDKLLAVADLSIITKDLEWVRHHLLLQDLRQATSGPNPSLKVRYADGREVGLNAIRDHVSEQKGEARYFLSRELGDWLQGNGWSVQYNSRLAGSPSSQLPQQGIERRRQDEVLRIIRDELNLDPKALPKYPNGRPGIPAMVKGKIDFGGDGLFPDAESLREAFKDLRKNKRIVYASTTTARTGG